MNNLEYQAAAMRTCPNLNDHRKMQAHAKLGALSEAGEIAGIFQKTYQGHTVNREHLAKELGDLMWMCAEYCTSICRLLPTDCDSTETDNEALCRAICGQAHSIAETPFGNDQVGYNAVFYLFAHIKALARNYDLSLSDIAMMNIQKLRARYPDGFSAEKSINRAEGDI